MKKNQMLNAVFCYGNPYKGKEVKWRPTVKSVKSEIAYSTIPLNKLANFIKEHKN